MERERITRQAEPADDAETDAGKLRFMTERLTRMHVRDMYFDDRGGDGRDRVTKRDRRVRVGTGIENDAFVIERIVQRINQLTFVIGLDERELNFLRCREQ